MNNNNNNNNIEIEYDSSSDSDNEAMKENYIELAKGFNDLMEKMKTKSKLDDAKITKNELIDLIVDFFCGLIVDFGVAKSTRG